MVCKLCGKEMQYDYDGRDKYYYCDCELYKQVEIKKEELYKARQKVSKLERELKELKENGVYFKELKAFEHKFDVNLKLNHNL